MADEEMVRFEAVRIRTDDLTRTAQRYALLLGCAPEHADAAVVRFALVPGGIEIMPGTPGVQGLRLSSVNAGGAGAALEAARRSRFGGIDVVVDPFSSDARALDTATPTAGGFLAIDHVVVNTPDCERAIRLWRDTLGVRLALDREFPARGLRMLFFRSAGVTLEMVSPIGGGGAGDDVQHGVAYRVADVARVRARLLAAGFDVSPVRDGNKRGTLVATVRNDTEGVPTLLIEAVAADGPRA